MTASTLALLGLAPRWTACGLVLVMLAGLLLAGRRPGATR